MHAGSTNLERQTDNDNEPDSDLQRLWARDTEDLGTFEAVHFISKNILSCRSLGPLVIIVHPKHVGLYSLSDYITMITIWLCCIDQVMLIGHICLVSLEMTISTQYS